MNATDVFAPRSDVDPNAREGDRRVKRRPEVQIIASLCRGRRCELSLPVGVHEAARAADLRMPSSSSLGASERFAVCADRGPGGASCRGRAHRLRAEPADRRQARVAASRSGVRPQGRRSGLCRRPGAARLSLRPDAQAAGGGGHLRSSAAGPLRRDGRPCRRQPDREVAERGALFRGPMFWPPEALANDVDAGAWFVRRANADLVLPANASGLWKSLTGTET